MKSLFDLLNSNILNPLTTSPEARSVEFFKWGVEHPVILQLAVKANVVIKINVKICFIKSPFYIDEILMVELQIIFRKLGF